MNEKQFAELADILGDIRALIQIGLRDRLAELRAEVLQDNDQMRAFRLFYQGESYREIGRQIGVSHATVSRWVDAWRSVGLVHPTEARCVVSPDALGLS